MTLLPEARLGLEMSEEGTAPVDFLAYILFSTQKEKAVSGSQVQENKQGRICHHCLDQGLLSTYNNDLLLLGLRLGTRGL